MSTLRECCTYALAGAGLALLLVAVVLAAVACTSARASDTGGWVMLQPGTTVINTPCGIVAIEVRANAERSVFWWRIVVIPKTVVIPPKPPKDKVET